VLQQSATGTMPAAVKQTVVRRSESSIRTKVNGNTSSLLYVELNTGLYKAHSQSITIAVTVYLATKISSKP
jgi:hypothetical protein